MSRLEAQLEDEDVNILLVDIHSPIGRELRARFGFRFTPTHILFDAQGDEVYRGSSVPSAEDIRALIP